jgi:ethanolamine-phosphate cytidylyltransferase
LLHAGHLSVLEKARLQGDYLIVGVYNDTLASVLRSKGKGGASNDILGYTSCESRHSHSSFDSTFPILSMEERVLSILGCKYVSDVLIDAPYVLSSDLLLSLNISIVITVSSYGATTTASHAHADSEGSQGSGDDPYKIPRERNILHTVTPSLDITGA